MSKSFSVKLVHLQRKMPINSVVLILNCKLNQVFMLRVYQFLTEKQISALEDLENLSSKCFASYFWKKKLIADRYMIEDDFHSF